VEVELSETVVASCVDRVPEASCRVTVTGPGSPCCSGTDTAPSGQFAGGAFKIVTVTGVAGVSGSRRMP